MPQTSRPSYRLPCASFNRSTSRQFRAVRQFSPRHLLVVGLAAPLLALGACRSSVPISPNAARMSVSLTAQDPRFMVIAHRGASGYRPEHTLEAYALAVAMGADYIEPDLVSTRDGVLVARHENQIGETTDVEQRFPERRATKVIDGESVTGWFTEDFTLAELRTLRARERLPFRDRSFDGQFLVPTFDEVLTLANRLSGEVGRVIGVYPETKHPTYFRSIGLPLEDPLLQSLNRAGLNRGDAPVFIQSFEVGNLRRLKSQTNVRLIQLITDGSPPDRIDGRDVPTYAEMITPDGLRAVAEYAYGIGAEKSLVIPKEGAATSLVRNAHLQGLKVHVWTLRREPQFVGARFAGDMAAEARAFAEAGVDGVFTDNADVVVRAVRP